MPRRRFLASARREGPGGGLRRELLGLVLIFALLAGLAYAQLQRPIPPVSARQTIAGRSTLPGPRPNIPWPQKGIGALGVTGFGLIETGPGDGRSEERRVGKE